MSDFRKPWDRSEFRSDRPSRPPFRKPWDHDEGGGRPAPRSGFRKPWDRDEGGDRPARSGGFRKPWDRDGGDRPAPRTGFRKPWEDRGPRGGDRPAFGPRKPRAAAIPAEGELLFGRQPVREMLRAGRRAVNLVVLSDGVKDSDEVLEIKRLCEERSIKIEFYKRDDLEAWVNGANHQGVVAFAAEFPYVELDEIAADLAAAQGNATVVVLDHVQDPQNLGSILRTCECAGVLGVVIPADRAVGVTPAAVRASAGAAEHLRIARLSNLVVALERFKGAGAWITGLEAVPSARPYAKVDYKGKACLVIGSEAHGICSPVRRKCDFLARLPMLGRVNSLNAGVATAIALYEMLRQQGANDVEANFPAVEEPVEAEIAEPSPEAITDEDAPEAGPAEEGPEELSADEAFEAEESAPVAEGAAPEATQDAQADSAPEAPVEPPDSPTSNS